MKNKDELIKKAEIYNEVLDTLGSDLSIIVDEDSDELITLILRNEEEVCYLEPFELESAKSFQETINKLSKNLDDYNWLNNRYDSNYIGIEEMRTLVDTWDQTIKALKDVTNNKFLNEYEIYQLNKEPESQKALFVNSELLKALNITLKKSMYNKIYEGIYEDGTRLDDLYEKFNIHRPDDFKGHSLSVSDVIVINHKDDNKVYMVDSFGYKDITDTFMDNELDMSKKKNKVIETGVQKKLSKKVSVEQEER